MGLGRYFLNNLLDAPHFTNLEQEMDDRKSYEDFHGKKAADPKAALEYELGYVSLVVRTLVEMMLRKKLCTRAELEDLMDRIDQMDGVRAGNIDPRNFKLP